MTKKDSRRPTILLIGPLPDTGRSETNVIGGNKVLASESVRELSMRGFDLDIIDTSGSVTNISTWKIRIIRLARFIRVVWKAAKKLRHSQIVFLIIAPYSATVVASSLWIMCKITHKPMVLRFSGSGLRGVYEGYSALTRGLANRTYMRSSLVYVETQQLCRSFDNPANFRWFPNVRDIETPGTNQRKNVKKLVFLGQLHMSKGLTEALDACHHLPENCHLNVFGPHMSDTDFHGFENHPRASYRGVLEPAEVPQTLSKHDLLLFPSYCRYEGYPGVILEAFQCGLPVIAAKWGGVPELVEHEESGLLVEPGSAAEVQAAIERLLEHPELYQRLCEGATRRGEYFRSSNWYDRVASELHSLARS